MTAEPEQAKQGAWTRVCGSDELAAPGVRTVVTAAGQVAVFRLQDRRLLAIEDRCPHRGALLSTGAVYDGDKVACLDHGWTVCLTDGVVEAPEHGCVRTFAVKIADGSIWVLP